MNAWIDRRRPRSRVRTLCAAGIAVAVVYALADVPYIAEYWFARGLTRWLSGLIGAITNVFPFSFYEYAAVALIAAALLAIVGFSFLLAWREYARCKRWLYRLALAGLAVALAFGVLYAPLYARAPAAEALGLSDERPITEEDVFAAAEYFVEELNALSAQMARDEQGNILPALSFSQTADCLNELYATVGGGYFASYEVRPKPVALSVPMTYLGISGIYLPFFAEANINTNIPAYQLPVTMAHEMAHAKGVSQESEANLCAYVLCVRAEENDIRYAGLMSVTASLLNSLSQAPYDVLYDRLDPAVKREYRNAREHFDRYDGWLDTLSTFFNDLFLKANGISSGTRSYGETARGLVALYRSLCKEAEN